MGRSGFRIAIVEFAEKTLSAAKRLRDRAATAIGEALARSYCVAEGNEANTRDIWFRVFTNDKNIQSGRIHHTAFNGKAITARQSLPWVGKAEVSGRLLSRAGTASDIAANGEARAAHHIRQAIEKNGRASSSIKFIGVGFAFVEDLQTWQDTAPRIFYEPTDDIAHSNLVHTKLDVEEMTYDLKRELSLKLRTLDGKSLSTLHRLTTVRSIERGLGISGRG